MSEPVTFLSKAADWAHSAFRGAGGVPVIYLRPSTSQSVSIEQAVKGTTRTETSDENGTILEAKIADWLIEASRIVLGGVVALPAEADEIQFVNGTTTEIYRVSPPAGQKCFVNSDVLGHTLRIHTKRTT
jgi:hypothetical protein